MGLLLSFWVAIPLAVVVGFGPKAVLSHLDARILAIEDDKGYPERCLHVARSLGRRFVRTYPTIADGHTAYDFSSQALWCPYTDPHVTKVSWLNTYRAIRHAHPKGTTGWLDTLAWCRTQGCTLPLPAMSAHERLRAAQHTVHAPSPSI